MLPSVLPTETDHLPVLADEVVANLDPRPGETVVDCTFGAGGHARLVAERLGAAGTIVCVDRDPAAEQRFAEFAGEVECDTRFLRIWDFYLAYCEAAFEAGSTDVMQFTLTAPR